MNCFQNKNTADRVYRACRPSDSHQPVHRGPGSGTGGALTGQGRAGDFGGLFLAMPTAKGRGRRENPHRGFGRWWGVAVWAGGREGAMATSYSIREGAQNMKRRNDRGFGSGVVSGCSWANFIGRGGEVRHHGEVNGGGRWWIFKMTVSKFSSFKKATR
jgi:hypothetical protein